MVEYYESSHLNQWLLESPEQLQECRDRANYEARLWLSENESSINNESNNSNENHADNNNNTTPKQPVVAIASVFACGYRQKNQNNKVVVDYTSQGPWKTSKGNEYLTPSEESILINFYASKLPLLIGPKASIPRLRRESKVTATAALLYRRFFLSNSVMKFDPKAILVASAFLASKVEDATADIRHLQEGTEKMQAPVPLQVIISSELALLQGCHYDLLCFHPFKAVLALTEDLRTFLKSDKGQNLVHRPISGQDLKPIYDKARIILDQITTCSDLTLLYSPGPIGLASLIVAQDEIANKAGGDDPQQQQQQQPPPQIDFYGYVQQRFPEQMVMQDHDGQRHDLLEILPRLCERLKQLPVVAATTEDDLAELKKVHKKLKKIRFWGGGNTSEKDSKKKKQSRKKETESSSDPTGETLVTTTTTDGVVVVDPYTSESIDINNNAVVVDETSTTELSESLSMPPPSKRIKVEQ